MFANKPQPGSAPNSWWIDAAAVAPSPFSARKKAFRRQTEIPHSLEPTRENSSRPPSASGPPRYPELDGSSASGMPPARLTSRAAFARRTASLPISIINSLCRTSVRQTTQINRSPCWASLVGAATKSAAPQPRHFATIARALTRTLSPVRSPSVAFIRSRGAGPNDESHARRL